MEFKKSNKAISDYESITKTKFPYIDSNLMTILDSDYENWEQENILKIKKIFKNEYNELIKSQNYFYGCTLKTYRNKYEKRLKEFLNNFSDTDEIDFIERELNIGARTMPIHHMYIEDEIYQRLDYSLKKRGIYLEKKINNLGYTVHYDFDSDYGKEIIRMEKDFNENLSNSKENGNTINWKGSPTELTALIKSLKESDKLDTSLSEKQIVQRFEKFFNFPLKGYDQTKSKIRKRTKDIAPFIDMLKINLEQWIKNKD